MKKPLSDDDIIRRGRMPEKHGLLGLLTVTLVATLPFILGAGFVAGGVAGAALSLWSGAGASEFIAGLAMGAMWGGILSTAGVFGAGVALGWVDDRYEKNARAINDAYEGALQRRAAVKQAAAPPPPESSVLPTGAEKAFAAARDNIHPMPARERKPARVIPPRAA